MEAGIDYQHGPISLSLMAYANRLKDAIANVMLGHGPGVFPGVGFVGATGTYSQRQNVRAISVRGIDVSAEWTDGPWSIRAGASIAHARMDGVRRGGVSRRAAACPDAPLFRLAVGELGKGREGSVDRAPSRWSQFDDDVNSDLLKGATTLEAFASWPVTKRLQLIARGENLMNSLVMAGINGDGSVERATPRTLWIGLRLR